MANRRMFSLKVIDTDEFLDMPQSTQLLYFHFSLRADDDGFVSSPKKILKMIGCGDDDIKVLFAKRFIIPFESGVCVIRHWRVHNYIQSDRYQETQYKLEKSTLKEIDGIYLPENTEIKPKLEDGSQGVSKMDTQDRLGKVSLDKDIASPSATLATFNIKEEITKLKESKQRHIQLIGEFLEEKGVQLESAEQLKLAISRHVRAAVKLAKFSDKRIAWASELAARQFPEIWVMETVLKILLK